MKKTFSCLLMTILIFCANSNIINASDIEKGNPSAIYLSDRIILSNNDEVELKEHAALLFLNGTLITDYEIIIRNDRTLVPVRLIAQELGASVDWSESNKVITITKSQKEIALAINSNIAFVNGIDYELDYPAIIYKDLTYVPLRFASENLEATVHYSPCLSNENTFYYDTKMPVSPADTIIRNFTNIIIDEKYNSSDLITKEEAMKITKEICLKGLENFSNSMRENLVSLNENPNRLDNEFKAIKKEIDRMMYIGEVSRFYKFTIGPYDILFDRINGKIFFVIYSSDTTVKEVNINDPGLYLPIFIVG
ncbi:stalk domain-containing protein [Alkaliphilus transvaalensis]|uniref:stalk domain-containing protein n=1 Tax=Alkaliphilus transvaalensis TaxID=114628 RepID=UPI00047CFFE3|nr:copper amine oxidase N-terminal domain-containing protein [Alkaliphilus transvaalensis]